MKTMVRVSWTVEDRKGRAKRMVRVVPVAAVDAFIERQVDKGGFNFDTVYSFG